MRKIFFLYLFISVILTSCNKDFNTINDNIKAAQVVPASTLFSNAQRELVDNMTTPSVNTNVFRLYAQYWAETTYADESQYNITTRNTARGWWNPLYRDVLKNFNESERLINNDKSFTDLQLKKNQLALNEILSVYTFSILVNTFGDIPYSEALDFTNATPKYDDAATIYKDLIKRLDAAITSMNVSSGSFGSADLVYGGDISKWIKFANSLKLRIGMTLADVDPATSKTLVEQAAPNVFTSNADKASMMYLASPPNTNPTWVNLIQSGRIDFVAANTFIDTLTSLNDPRIPFFFNKDKNGGYSGGIYGSVNNNANFSLPSSKITDPSFPGVLMDYAEVEFYLAEAVERGYSVGGTAEDHYNKGVTASILDWGGKDTDAATYLLNPLVAYKTASGSYKKKIGTQKWISLYNRGFEAWTEYRRLDYPILNPVSAADAQGPFPVRFTYSDQEPNLNKVNYDAASAKIGGDKVTTKLFWDKF